MRNSAASISSKSFIGLIFNADLGSNSGAIVGFLSGRVIIASAFAQRRGLVRPQSKPKESEQNDEGSASESGDKQPE